MRNSTSILLAFVLLSVPDSFAADLNLSENFSVRHAAEQARRLLDQGGEAESAKAAALLNAVLDCQETRAGAAHRGNFLSESRQEAIQDVNSVEFVLTDLIPLLHDHGERLPEDLRNRVKESTRLGLEEIRDMDVALTYTNIAAMDCANSCLGGELLEDKPIAERGYKRFREFFGLIADNGNVFEFNSPTYTQVTLKALDLLKRHVKDPSTRLLAELAATRLGLSVALHLHPQSGRLAGPYSRAYYPTLQPTSRAYSELLQTWIKEGILPEWIGTVARPEKLPFFLEETAHADWRIGATTYLTPSFSMGLASREVSRQTNPLVIQVYGADPSETAMIFARYSMNDSIEKEVPPKSAFGIDGSFFDDGKFLGVQRGNRAIGVYAPREAETPDSLAPASRHRFAGARASLVWLDRKKVSRIWVGESEVRNLPHRVERGQVVVIETPPARIAVLPLSITELGYESPIRISEKGGRLYLDMYNYLGEEKTFGELDRGSRFYRGQSQCAFYVEVADQSAHPDAPSFARKVAEGVVRDEVPPPFTSYHDNARRPWVLEYAREGETLGLEVDLMAWELTRRWNETGELGWPMLESPMARQSAEGRIDLAGATLECGKAPALLYGDPAAELWVAAYYGDPAPLSLSLPGGSVHIERMGPGSLIWRKGEVTLDTLDLEGTPTIVGGVLREREKGADQ